MVIWLAGIRGGAGYTDRKDCAKSSKRGGPGRRGDDFDESGMRRAVCNRAGNSGSDPGTWKF